MSKKTFTDGCQTDAPGAPSAPEVRQHGTAQTPVNAVKNKMVRQGSSPIGHPKKTAQTRVNIEVQKIKVRQLVAHFDSQSKSTPGGASTFDDMNHQITTNTTGKRWYVSYYVTENGKKLRKRAYGRVNAEKDLNKRMELLEDLRKEIFNALQFGHDVDIIPLYAGIPIYTATDTMIADKKRYLKKKSIPSIVHHLGKWKAWLLATKNNNKHPANITRADIIRYRDHLISKGIGNRTVNNNLREVSSLFNYLIDSDSNIVFRNPCIGLKKLPSRSETHVSYTAEQFQQMVDYLKEKDRKLLFYIKLIAFAYLRTDEARLLQIRHIDVPGRKILLTAAANKNNTRTYKIIQEIIADEFESRQLNQYPDDYFLFSRGADPGELPVGENYFRKHFKKVKQKFGLSKKHTIYGFRHTSVIQLLEGGTKWHKAMDLTGHERMESFQQYARSILGKQPEDYSGVYTVKL